MHEYLLMRRTEYLQQLAEEQRRQMEAEARAEAERERAAQERAQHVESWISLLGVFIGAPALIIGFLGINLQGTQSQKDSLGRKRP